MKNFFLPLLVLGMTLSGCSAYDDVEESQAKENYTKIFIKQFGLIDPNHTWGFGEKTKSRALSREVVTEKLDGSKMNTQGNLWKNPPMVKDWEEEAVMAYLRSDKPKVTVNNLNITTSYFITHVGCTSKKRVDVNGTERDNFVGDQLKVAYEDGWTIEDMDTHWDHAKDFNSSSNKDNLGNTVCVDGGSQRFAYHSGYDSEWYDNYIIIPGSEIDYRLSSYYYLCFDFEAYKNCAMKTSYRVHYKFKTDQNEGTDYTNREQNDVYIDGIYEHEWGYSTKPSEEDILAALRKKLGDQTMYDLKIVSYEKETQAYPNGDKFIKADGIYDDWVIRLCGNAIPRSSKEIPLYPYDDPDTERVFVEDLSIAAAHNLNSNASDWDFNDLVFDVRFTKVEGDDSKKEATILLRALGGTLPIFIGDGQGHFSDELHKYFKVSQSEMVNTGAGPVRDVVNISDLLKEKGVEFQPVNHGGELVYDARCVKIYIMTAATYDELSMTELTADPGQAPSKLCVPSYLAAPTECMIITTPYPNFESYVNKEPTYKNFWEHKDNINNKKK